MDHFLGRNDEQMQCRGILHIVEAGDTLYRIGKKYGVPVSRIMYANPYVNIYNLQPGDEICVPVMTPRMPMGENGMPGQTGWNQMVPMRENQTGRQEPDMRGNRGGRREPGGQMRPMRETQPGGYRTAPMQENDMPDSMTPAIENPMGFPLTPLKEIVVGSGREEVDSTYMGNRMSSAEEDSRSRMRGADSEDAAEDQRAREQAGMRRTQEATAGGYEENQQMPSEPMCAEGNDRSKMCPAAQKHDRQENQEPVKMNDMDRKYAPAEGCMGNEPDCSGMKRTKSLPWDDTGVSEQMMRDYLQKEPK